MFGSDIGVLLFHLFILGDVMTQGLKVCVFVYLNHLKSTRDM